MYYLKKNILNKLIEWTLAERPNEAAGYLFVENSIFKKIITGNHSVGHFIDDNLSQLVVWIEKYGAPSAIFHSHPCQAIPSGMDYIYMKNTIPLFRCVWLIMSDMMKLRAWSIRIDLSGNIFGIVEVEVCIN